MRHTFPPPVAKTSSKKAYHHGDLRRAILRASAELIEERGVEALSLREAARRAGVSAGAPYHHFGSKAELLGALAADGFATMHEQMVAALESVDPEDSIARLGAIGRAYIGMARANPVEFRLMFRPGLVSREHLPAGCEPDASFELLKREVAKVADVLPGRPVTSEAIAILAWSVVHGASELVLDGPLATPSPMSAIAPEDVGSTAVMTLGVLLRMLAESAHAPPIAEPRATRATKS